MERITGNDLHKRWLYTATLIRNSTKAVLDSVPCNCVVCASTAIHSNLCTLCLDDLPRIHSVCVRCALPVVQGTLCGPCLLKPPLWQSMTCAAPYSEPFDTLVSRFKFQGRTEIATALSALLLEAISNPGPVSVFASLNPAVPELPDTIVPVPLHWTRHWKRGFNQAALLACSIGRELDIPVVHALTRHRRTRAQTLIDPGKRKANLRNAFRTRSSVQGLHIALLDDVVTTGATATAATRTLLKSGALSVRLWACVRASSKHHAHR